MHSATHGTVRTKPLARSMLNARPDSVSKARREKVLYVWPVAVLLASVACSSGLPRPPYAPQKTDALVPVPFPPPPARVEFVPDRPNSDCVWIDGEWEWTGRVWTWKRGRWVEPVPYTTFSPWTTVRGSDGVLYLASGTWRDTKGNEVQAPRAIAYGKPTAGALVDSEGVSEHTGRNIKEDKGEETGPSFPLLPSVTDKKKHKGSDENGEDGEGGERPEPAKGADGGAP